VDRSDPGGGRPSRQVGWGAGLVIVALMALFAGGITYLTERAFCAVAPNVPFLGESCATDPVQWAVIMSGAVGGVSLLVLLIGQLRSRK
jgi:hypothetical protein